MQIIDKNALKFQANPDLINQIIRYIPKSQHLGGNDAMIYWGQGETEALVRMTGNLSIPSPMLRDYTWPGMLAPMAHQKETASFLSIRRRAFCFSDAGTGKTAAALWAADYLMDIGAVGRVLIICPLSIMYTAWQAELFKTVMHRRAVVAYNQNAEKRRELLNGDYEFTVINYDGINTVFNDIVAKRYDLIIVDEANFYKSATTKRWKLLNKVLMPSTRLWMMTGTPAAQSPVDAYGLAKLVCPERVPQFFTAWKEKVMYQVSKFSWVPRPNHKAEVFRALQPAIRFEKSACVDLPPVTFQVREVPLSVQAARYYKELKKQLLIEAAGQEISAVNAGVALNKLLQLSGGAVYTDTGNVVEFDATPRLKALEEVLDECSRKVVIFVPYLHSIPIVTKFLDSALLTSMVITGKTPPHQRKEIIKSFQEQPDPRILVCQPATMSHGVTLTAADTLVFWGPVLSVETYLQCVARIDRIGQTANMTVVKLMGSEVERKVYKMLDNKIDNHRGIVDLYKSVMTQDEL